MIDEWSNPNRDSSDRLNDEAVQEIFSLLGDKWTLPVLLSIASFYKEGVRFTEIERKTKGISQRMLASRLKSLENFGILRREAFSQVPVRVEYAMTDSGKALYKAYSDFAYVIASNFKGLDKGWVESQEFDEIES